MVSRPLSGPDDPLSKDPTLPASAFSDAETNLRPRQPGEGAPTPCGWALVVYAGQHLGRLFSLQAGENLIGRAPNVQVSLPDDEVSRVHVRVMLESRNGMDQLLLEDLSSTNGTFVNGQAVTSPRTVVGGDRIAVGGHVLKLVALDPLERSFHETLLDQSTKDPLTGLSNRGSILGELRNRFELSRRHVRPLCVVMADLDHFKNINDTHGHGVGDQVLAGFGELVRQNLRGTDLAGRIGGEEFLLVLPETEQAGAMQLAERLRGTFAGRTYSVTDGILQVTCSLGVAECRPEDRDAGDLLGRADEALYQAKQSGRDRAVPARSKRR